MRRSRAYILTEIMMSMLLQAMFIVVLSGAFYMMLSFYTKTQQLQTARERGHRVISYFDQRIRHVGLGLWDCASSGNIKDAKLFPVDKSIIASNEKNLPVSLISLDPNDNEYFKVNEKNATTHYNYDDNTKTFSGNVVTLLYGYKDFDNERKLILKNNYNVNNTTSTPYTIIDSQGIQNAGFNKNDSNNGSNRYSVMESVGLPLVISSDTSNKIALGFENGVTYSSTAYAGSEILHVGCERLFVTSNDVPENRSFAFAFPGESTWSQEYHHVAGILEIYMELHAPTNGTKTFDLYVLSTGGRDSKAGKSRPASWPAKAHPTQSEWNTARYADYKDQVLYVSRASWKLNNIPKNFVFSYHN